MALHAPSWPLLRQDSMTAASSDFGIIQPANEQQRQRSNSNDHEWARFLASLNHHDQEPSSNSNGIDIGNLDLNDNHNISTQFGSMDSNVMMMHTDPLPSSSSTATATSSALLPVFDSNNTAPPQQYMNWQPQPMEFSQYEPASTSWMSGQQHQQQQQQQQHLHQYDQNAHFIQGGDGLGIHMAPTSHPVYNPSTLHYDQPFLSQEQYAEDYHRQDMSSASNSSSMWGGGGGRHQEQSLLPQDDLFANADDDDAEPEDSTSGDPCYAQLLHRCLKEAPNHTMSLRDLYDWVSAHSQKAKDQKNRGWQNSVRHNLSMNAAFQRVQHTPSTTTGQTKPKGSLWRLTPEALQKGVISTTRYRKDPKNRKTSRRRSATPALNRQVSGARGGRATRDAIRARQLQRGSPALGRFRRSERFVSPYSCSPSPGMGPTSSSPLAAASPYFLELDGDETGGFPLSMSSSGAGQTPLLLPSDTMYNNNGEEDVKPLLLQQQNLDFLSMDHGGGQGGGGGLFTGHESYHPHPHHLYEQQQHQQQQHHHQQQQHQQQQLLATPTLSQASYMTDTSFMSTTTDENVPGLMMSGSGEDSREGTIFQ